MPDLVQKFLEVLGGWASLCSQNGGYTQKQKKL
jgi:hypothetical protein